MTSSERVNGNSQIPIEQDRALLSVRNLSKRFPVRSPLFSRQRLQVHAVDDVSFDVRAGHVVGLVGESGSGKTTTGRAVLRLIEPSSGAVFFDGVDLTTLSKAALRPYRRRMQIIFQDPFASLNPRLRVGAIVAEGLRVHRLASGGALRARVVDLLEQVGLSADHLDKYPHEFSGGQRQRIGIARALAVNPSLIVADEPVSALDVSVQAQVVNLLKSLQESLNLTMLFIAHDLGVVEYLCDEVVVMYLGRVMEVASTKQLYSNPVHPYTEALLSAAPIPDPDAKRDRIILKGETPSPITPPSGCVFRTRCPISTSECSSVVPPLESVGPGHLKACIRR